MSFFNNKKYFKGSYNRNDSCKSDQVQVSNTVLMPLAYEEPLQEPQAPKSNRKREQKVRIRLSLMTRPIQTVLTKFFLSCSCKRKRPPPKFLQLPKHPRGARGATSKLRRRISLSLEEPGLNPLLRRLKMTRSLSSKRAVPQNKVARQRNW